MTDFVVPLGIDIPRMPPHNILAPFNFTFESGISGWSHVGNDAVLAFDTSTAGVGSGSLHVTAGLQGPTVGSTGHGNIALAPKFGVSFWMKASAPVEAFATVNTDFSSHSANFNIDTTWRQYTMGPFTFAGTVFTQFSAGPNVPVSAGFEYWIDDIQINDEFREAVGAPAVFVPVNPTGIASAQAVGTPSVARGASPTGIASAGVIGIPSIRSTAYFATPPTRQSYEIATGSPFWHYFQETEGVTWYKVAGIWSSGNNLPADLVADELYRGGYEYEIANTTKVAELEALGFTIRTEIR